MKILFIVPPHRSYVIQPNLGLGYLASAVRKVGQAPFILDCVKDKIGVRRLVSIVREGGFDAVGFHMFSQDYYTVKQLSGIVKKMNRKIYTIAGGPHPSGDPQDVIDNFPDIDFVFCGEAETGLPKLLQLLSQRSIDYSVLSQIEGLCYNGKHSSNEARLCLPFIENLDNTGFPAWDLMRPDAYPEAPHGAFIKQFPVAPIIIGRGCPFECTFCAGAGRRYRERPLDNVMEEIGFLDETYGVKEFLVEDENLTLHRELVRNFCESILRTGRGYTWSCPTGIRLSGLRLEDFQLMERAGCHSVSVGIEFGSQRVHEITKKGLTIELIREKLSLLTRTNIRITGFFLLGVPGETLSEMEETVKLALALPIHRIQVNNFMPLPGSQIWDNLKKEDRLKDVNYSRFFVHDVAYAPPGIERCDIKRLQRKAYLRFYFRWKIIKDVLSDIRSFNHFKYLIKRFFDALF